MKAAEVHKMKDAELVEEADRLRRKLYDLKSSAVTEKLENPRAIGEMKKDIARLLTESSSRKLKKTQETA